MIALLLLLTCINYVVFAESAPPTTIAWLNSGGGDDAETDTNPAGPDEKAPGNPVSISEEYLHDHQDASNSISDILTHQLLMVCSKVHPVHFELITPPPDMAS
ncbi:MAG: hypothetical protein H7Y31_14375 [Chitinophagaceae bacterium]|nr:hypothetical protein [Chitinophagaceae bacterium]